jgi:chromosome segregation ATPase
MTARENYLEKRQAAEAIDTTKYEFKDRIKQAKSDIATLEEEKLELKKKRPAMLADNEDISELSKRLKEIDEEIEICQDMILGLEEKLKIIKSPLEDAIRDAHIAFEEMVKAEMDKIVPKYQKYAQKLADVILDYNALEKIYNGRTNYLPKIKTSLETIPNLLNPNEPILQHLEWEKFSKIIEAVKKKYKLTDF